MWINNNLHLPLKEGFYRCLVDTDGFGNLEEVKDNFYNGQDWCDMNSCRQYITYWKASKKDWDEISDKLEKEREEYFNK